MISLQLLITNNFAHNMPLGWVTGILLAEFENASYTPELLTVLLSSNEFTPNSAIH